MNKTILWAWLISAMFLLAGCGDDKSATSESLTSPIVNAESVKAVEINSTDKANNSTKVDSFEIPNDTQSVKSKKLPEPPATDLTAH